MATMIEIKWTDSKLHFRLNTSDHTHYPSENEVLLYDGVSVIVEEIIEDYEYKEKKLILVKMKHEKKMK